MAVPIHAMAVITVRGKDREDAIEKAIECQDIQEYSWGDTEDIWEASLEAPEEYIAGDSEVTELED